MLVAIKYNSTQIKYTLSLPNPKNYLQVTFRPEKRVEKNIKNNADKKGGWES